MSEAVIDFRAVAKRFCRVVEGYDGADWKAFQLTLRHTLADLISAAHALPEVEPTEADSINVPHEEWQKLFEHLKNCLEVQEYWLVFSPLDHSDHEPVCGDLADDLADIWRDLQLGLRTANATDATWEWWFSFHSHWGHHATSALSCLHRSAGFVA